MKNLSAAAQLLTGAAKSLQPGAETRAGHRARALLFSAVATGRWYFPGIAPKARKELDAIIPRVALQFVRETRERETLSPVEVYEDLKSRLPDLHKVHEALLRQDRSATYRVYSSTASDLNPDYADSLNAVVRDLRKVNTQTRQFYDQVYEAVAEATPDASVPKLCADARRVVRCVTYYLKRVIETKCGGIAYATAEMGATQGTGIAYPLVKEDDINDDHRAAIRAGFLTQFIIGGLEIPYCRVLNIGAVIRATGKKWTYSDFLPSDVDGRGINIQVRTLDQDRKRRQSFVIERDYSNGMMLPPLARGRTLQVMLSEFAKAVGHEAAGDMRCFVAWVALDKNTAATQRLKERDLQRVAALAGENFERVTRDQTLYLDVADTLAGIREEVPEAEFPDPPGEGSKRDKGDFVLHFVQSSSCKKITGAEEGVTQEGTLDDPSLSEPNTPPLSRIRRKVPAPVGAEILDADPESE